MIENGKPSGKVIEPIHGHYAKLGALKEIAVAMGRALVDTLAVGDDANDLAMLQTAGLGAAYRASPRSRPARERQSTTPTSPRCCTRKAFARKCSSRMSPPHLLRESVTRAPGEDPLSDAGGGQCKMTWFY
jgi:haloacid dehalogenase-like hydrolase